MSDITAVAREDITVRCYISGYPIPDISWEHGKTCSTHVGRERGCGVQVVGSRRGVRCRGEFNA